MKNRIVALTLALMIGALTAGCARVATPIAVTDTPAAGSPGVTRAPEAIEPTAERVADARPTRQAACLAPKLIGLDRGAAGNMVTQLGLQPLISAQYDDSVAEGVVVDQSPAAGARIDPCAGDVEMRVSLGPQPTLTPKPATATPAKTATPAPPPPSPTPDKRLFWDDFTSGLKPDWEQVQGRCQMVDEQLQCPSAPFRLEVGDYNWRDYRLEFDTGAGYWKFHPPLAIMVHLAEDDSYFALRIPDCGAPGWAYGKPDGSEEGIAGTNGVEICGNGPFHVAIECRGDIYTAIVNGQVIGKVQDARAQKGRIGIWSTELRPWFDNIEVTPLD